MFNSYNRIQTLLLDRVRDLIGHYRSQLQPPDSHRPVTIPSSYWTNVPFTDTLAYPTRLAYLHWFDTCLEAVRGEGFWGWGVDAGNETMQKSTLWILRVRSNVGCTINFSVEIKKQPHTVLFCRFQSNIRSLCDPPLGLNVFQLREEKKFYSNHVNNKKVYKTNF